MAKKGKKPARRPPPIPPPIQIPRSREPLQLSLPQKSLHHPSEEEATHQPISETELTVKHSLEIVKTVITATILEIIWIRRVFPEHEWRKYTWNPADADTSYGSFLKGIGSKNRPNYELTNNLMFWHFPRRGDTPGLDKLLDCLESGAHDALTKGYLHKLNFSIARIDDGPITRENLIESYTIQISYESGNVTSQIYSETRRTESGNSGPGILTDMKIGARELIDNLAEDLWSTSKKGGLKSYPLPASFRMVMTMGYTDQTPSAYQAPRFQQGDERASLIINVGTFPEKYTFNTGHHGVAVGLHLPGEVAQQSTQTHQNIENGDPGPSRPSRYAQNPTSTSVRSRQNSMLSESEGGHTHPEAMRQFGGMGAFRQPNTETQDTRQLHRSSLAPPRTPVERPRSAQSQPRPKYPPYTQSMLDFLDSQGDVNGFADLECDCGVENEAEDKLFCKKCKTFQHPQCYGYHDDHHPVYIVCYKCLLHPDDAPDEEELYQEMRQLCVKRRILAYLTETDSPVHIKRINEYSSGDPDRLRDTEVFLEELQHEGFVRLAEGLLQDKDSMAFYTLDADEDVVRSHYFRPEYKISHHFAVPETPSSFRMNENLNGDARNGSGKSPSNTRTPADVQSVSRDAEQLYAAASSTQDTCSYPSRSRGSSQSSSSNASPQRTLAMTREDRRSSSNMKRTADPHVDGRSPKRRYTAMNSPWFIRANEHE